MRLSGYLVGVICTVALVAPAGATACSCATPESDREAARLALERDLAFIGVLRSVKRIGDAPEPGEVIPPGSGIYRYRVIEAYGGSPGRFVRVRSSLQSSACGLPRGRGRTFAMGADRARDGVLGSGLCSLVSPRALRNAAAETAVRRPDAPRCRPGR
jgi:hypothetical protein